MSQKWGVGRQIKEKKNFNFKLQDLPKRLFVDRGLQLMIKCAQTTKSLTSHCETGVIPVLLWGRERLRKVRCLPTSTELISYGARRRTQLF